MLQLERPVLGTERCTGEQGWLCDGTGTSTGNWTCPLQSQHGGAGLVPAGQEGAIAAQRGRRKKQIGVFVGHGGMWSPAVSLWNSCDSAQETGLVKVGRKDNFEETLVQIEVTFSLANPHVVFFLEADSIVWDECQNRYPLSLLPSEKFSCSKTKRSSHVQFPHPIISVETSPEPLVVQSLE